MASIIDDLVSPEQSAFVKGRQILDGPLIVNEVIDWFKRKKKKLMVLKVEFDKAYDYVSWHYLLNIMEYIGFYHKCLRWILTYLESSCASVLLNASPTKEFKLKRGLG